MVQRQCCAIIRPKALSVSAIGVKVIDRRSSAGKQRRHHANVRGNIQFQFLLLSSDLSPIWKGLFRFLLLVLLFFLVDSNIIVLFYFFFLFFPGVYIYPSAGPTSINESSGTLHRNPLLHDRYISSGISYQYLFGGAFMTVSERGSVLERCHSKQRICINISKRPLFVPLFWPIPYKR